MELLRCPLCHEPLSRAAGSLACPHKHSFDVAREGYVNLLLPQHRRTKEPGDNAAMIAARARFLNAGHYEKLVETLQRIVADLQGPLLDLGCGEGYFTHALSSVITPVYGIDISKPAIRAACKRSREMTLVVASSARLPLPDRAFGVATALMAPLSEDVGRVLSPGGMLIRVTPGPYHLKEIKQVLYSENRTHRRAELELPLFTLVRSDSVISTDHLNLQSRADLIEMTPMQYRSVRGRRTTALVAKSMSVRMDFTVDLFRRD